MYQYVAPITARLAEALGPQWAVVNGTEAQDRRQLPRASVRLSGAALSGTSGPGVTLQVRYSVHLVVDAGAAAAPFDKLDAAVTAAIAALHHWRPDGASARLALQGLTENDYLDASLFGYELGLSLTVMHQGNNA